MLCIRKLKGILLPESLMTEFGFSEFKLENKKVPKTFFILTKKLELYKKF